MPKHYIKGPSRMDRLINCPGSAKMEHGLPDNATVYANEGTQCHDLAADILTNLVCGNHAAEPSVNGCSPEMFAHASEYAKVAAVYLSGCDRWWIEKTFVSEAVKDFGGTSDAGGIAGETMVVLDLKYGRSPVPAEHNLQLLAYAALAIEHYNVPIKNLLLGIYQPRTPGPALDIWEASITDVVEFTERLMQIGESDELTPGKHCTYCRAVAICPAVQHEALKAAGIDLAALPQQEQYAAWARIMEVAPAINKLLKEVPAKMLTAIRDGAEIPGWKAVKKSGNKKWTESEDVILKTLMARKIRKRDATVTKLRTPTQLANEGFDIEGLYDRDTTTVLKPSSDPRPAYKFPAAFDPIEESSVQ